jgi:hypothetical protein
MPVELYATEEPGLRCILEFSTPKGTLGSVVVEGEQTDNSYMPFFCSAVHISCPAAVPSEPT